MADIINTARKSFVLHYKGKHWHFDARTHDQAERIARNKLEREYSKDWIPSYRLKCKGLKTPSRLKLAPMKEKPA